MDTEFHPDTSAQVKSANAVHGVAIWDWELASDQVSVSRQWKQLRGFDPQDSHDLVARSLDSVHHDDRAELETQRVSLIQGLKSAFTLDYRVRRPSGSYVWIEERCQAVRDQSGKVIRLVGCEIDITNRKQDELMLNDFLLRSAVEPDALPVAICKFEDRHCVYVNEFWSKLTGRPRESALGDGWIEAIHPDDREKVLTFKEKYQQGQPGSVRVVDCPSGRHLKPDGSINWFVAKNRIKYGEEGEVASAIVTVFDVTERKQLEQQEARLIQILEATPDYVGIASPQREILWHNRRLRELRPDLSNPHDQPDFSVAHPEWSRKIMEEVAIPAAIEHGSWSGEMAIFDLEGNEIPVSQVLIAHKDASGELEALSTVMRDISDQKSTERALRESERMFASLAAAAPIAIFRMHESPTNCTYVNKRWEELTQRPLGSALGNGWMDAVHPADLERLAELGKDFLTDTTQLVNGPYEVRHVLPDGSISWVLCTLAKELDEKGNVTGYIGTLADIDPLKRADEDLKQFNQRFQKILEFSSIGIWQWSFAQEKLSWDSQMFEIYGVDPEDFHGVHADWEERVHPNDLERIKTGQANKALKGENAAEEFRIVRPNGELRHLYSNVYLETDENGKPIRAIGINMDITDRREVELALSESENKFQRIAENVPGMVYRYIVHPDGSDELTYVSSKVRELYGVEPAAALEDVNRLWNANHPDDLPGLLTLKETSAKDLTPFLSENRVRHPEKGQVWVQTCSQPFRLENGDVVWDGIQIDITSHKEAELALAEANTQLERMTENIPGMVFRYVYRADGNHSMSYVSPQCRGFFEVEPEAAMENADSLFKFIHPEDLTRVVEAIKICSETLKPFKEEYRVLLPEQGLRWRQSIGQPTRSENGDTVWDGVVLDITARKATQLALQQANEQLAKATRMKDEFLANMSHELRTPLSAILGMAEGLQNEIFGTLTKSQHNSLATIEQSGQHLLQLIDEILDLAKIEAGGFELDLTEVGIMNLCESSLQVISQAAQVKNIELRLNVQWNLPSLAADEKRLRQILINLLSNAIKFTPEGGTVSLDVQRIESAKEDPQEVLRICVRDNGLGIEASQLDAVFQPFVQGDASLSRDYDGVGLGLALVKRFVSMHAGEVHVSSELGKGSCFVVELPYHRPEQSVSSRPQASPALELTGSSTSPSPGAKVLLVEDSEPVAASVVAYLSSCHYEVQTAGDGIAALEIAQDFLPDVVLMDIQMPKLDGLEAIRQIRQNSLLSKVPIIALTGRAMPGDQELCLEAGADRYLSKPAGVKDLAQMIAELLQARD